MCRTDMRNMQMKPIQKTMAIMGNFIMNFSIAFGLVLFYIYKGRIMNEKAKRRNR